MYSDDDDDDDDDDGGGGGGGARKLAVNVSYRTPDRLLRFANEKANVCSRAA